ncbi:DUF4439 domain-containing protein [Nocardioides speluncae]|uniref:DUF4439 domain-containing protein n=1 Tax=Nocardioides speluncae TaxID=2670337 RepID=UPI000D68F19A|nr:DUF4439 domain-containing protein [Nocardioides speluncae]
MTPLEALQATLAAEHAAVWTFGTLGARTSQSASPQLYERLRESHLVHRNRRDQLSREIRDLGDQPAAAAPAYALSNPAVTIDEITSAALAAEAACTASYADLVTHTSGARRAWAVSALTNAAVRKLAFQGSPEIFPGVGELTDR